MPIYNVVNRRQRVIWDISRPVIPSGGGRAAVSLQGTLNAVAVGQTLNFEVDPRFTGLVTRRLTFCCAVCMVLFVNGIMHRISMHHVLGGDPLTVNWSGLTANMRPSISGSVTKIIVVAWNEGPVPQEMTRIAAARTGIAEPNIYHYLSNDHSVRGITFAVMWPSFAGEW